MKNQQLFAVVLAAGTASRFGSSKQLAEYAGEPLVRRATRLAEQVCGARTIVVLGKDWERVHHACAPLRGFLVRNEAYASGMASSIAAGVRSAAAAADAVLLMLCDQPLLTEESLHELIAAWGQSRTTIACSTHGGISGPPAVFPARYFPELMQLDGDRGARSLLEKYASNVERVSCAAAATDIDTPGDLLALLRHAPHNARS